MLTSLSRRFHIINARKVVRSSIRQLQTTSSATVVRTTSPRTHHCVFEKVGLDYAGPFLVKYGFVRKPVIVKAYLCVFVSLTVKAIHLELVSDLTSEAALRRFVARRGCYGVITAQTSWVQIVNSPVSRSQGMSFVL